MSDEETMHLVFLSYAASFGPQEDIMQAIKDYYTDLGVNVKEQVIVFSVAYPKDNDDSIQFWVREYEKWRDVVTAAVPEPKKLKVWQ